MKLITRLNKASAAEHHWYEQYGGSLAVWDSPCMWINDKRTKRQVHEKLIALGKNPSPEDVNDAIGNTSWTDCRCDECGKMVDAVVQIGQEPDYDSATAYVCIPCLKKAVKLK